MGATSAGLPAIYLPAGPMLRGNWKGKILGSGSDAWKYLGRKAGRHHQRCGLGDIEAGIARSYGTCMTMGTASTMTAIAEAIGMTLAGRILDPGGGFEPHPHERGMRPTDRRDGLGGPDAAKAF